MVDDKQIKTRAKEILKQMTVDEKIAQMNIHNNINGLYEEYLKSKEFEARFGTFHSPKEEKNLDKLQEYCVNNTRLGIPLIPADESLHGLQNEKATVFPQCAGIGCSFDSESVAEMADAIGFEARTVGIRQVYAPCIDIARDPRWGRMQENYGEDPYLVGVMGAEYIKGIQKHNVAACAKHYIGYGVPEGGINLAPAHLGEREIREVMLEPFKMAVDAGVMSIMPSYNEIDGEPLHASKKYMRDILRDELGFDGVTVSDYGAVEMLNYFQCVAQNELIAGKMALNAGIDVEAPKPYGYGETLKKAIENKEIDEKLIDEAVLRILELKLKVGLFDNPYAKSEDIPKLHNKSFVELSRKLDEESILLLENDGILPINEKKYNKIAVIGNNAKNSFLGDYISDNGHCVSFFDGIVNRVGIDRVLYSMGCNPVSYTDEMIIDAVETAKKSDLVFLVLGDCATKGGGVGGESARKGEVTCGEGYDMHTLDFPVSQQKLFDEITKLNKPTVLILYAGRPYTIMEQVSKVNAFMFSFGGGEQSGNAFANLIFGDKSPSAKLSFSFPQSTGHIPCYYNCKVSARGTLYKNPGSLQKPGRDYVLSSPKAWYPFGYGLTYTNVEYSNLSTELNEDGTVTVNVTVKNKGNYPINESVLLFVKAMFSPITPFVKRLRRFKKIYLDIGECKMATFVLTDDDFSYVNHSMSTEKLFGAYKIQVEELEEKFIYKEV